MTIVVEVTDFDTEFNTLPHPAVIVNDLPIATEGDRRILLTSISSTFSQDMISMLPTCSCGTLKNVPIGTLCSNCMTTVDNRHAEEVKAMLWFRRPDIDGPNPTAKLLNPYIWVLLNNRLTRSGFSYLQYITDPGYVPKVKTPPAVQYLQDVGVKRDYNWFVENFWDVIDLLFSRRDIGKKPSSKDDNLLALMKQLGSSMFSDYLPIPNKAFLVTEVSQMGVFIDPVTTTAKDSILSVASIDRDFYDQDPRTKRIRAARFLQNISHFYRNYIYENMAQKSGQFRKHWFGTRGSFTFRYVITSLEGNHRYDEVHVPWAVGLTCFRPHLLNKLKKLGWRLNDAVGLLNSSVHKYNELLDTLLKELVEESDGGIPCTIQRN